MHILVTNDDGVQAPGILALAQALRQIGGVEVTVLAPDRNWSVSSHAKTLTRPLRVKEVELADGTKALASDGSPSDCVALALLGLLEKPVDLVVSGINSNTNLGHDVVYSGTVAAAMEAAIGGVPGIAVSVDRKRERGWRDYGAAAVVARWVTEWVIRHGLPDYIVLNVNVPAGELQDFRGLEVTRLGLRLYHDRLEKRIDPYGRPYYWVAGDPPTGVPDEGTDIGAIENGYISVTPLQMDMTAYGLLDEFAAMEKMWGEERKI